MILLFQNFAYLCTPKRGVSVGAVAQSVEQRTENPCVAGSIPAHTTSKKKPFSVKTERLSCFKVNSIHFIRQ